MSSVSLTLSILTLTLITIVCARNVDFLRDMGASMAQISTPGMKRSTPSVLVNESSKLLVVKANAPIDAVNSGCFRNTANPNGRQSRKGEGGNGGSSGGENDVIVID